MTNLAKVAKGFAFFMAGYFIVIILNFIIPPTITAMDGIFPTTELEGTIWFGLIILYLLIMMVLPLYFVVTGLQEESSISKPIEAILGILIFIFAMAITIKAWYMVPTLSGLATGFTLVLFWIGLTIVWLALAVVTPAYMIINSFKN